MVPRAALPPSGSGLRARRHPAAARHRRVPLPARLQVLAGRDCFSFIGMSIATQ